MVMDGKARVKILATTKASKIGVVVRLTIEGRNLCSGFRILS